MNYTVHGSQLPLSLHTPLSALCTRFRPCTSTGALERKVHLLVHARESGSHSLGHRPYSGAIDTGQSGELLKATLDSVMGGAGQSSMSHSGHRSKNDILLALFGCIHPFRNSTPEMSIVSVVGTEM